MKNILKQVFKKLSLNLPKGPAWHQDLINSSVNEKIISEVLAEEISEYMGFRHFVAHGYAFNLNAERLQELANSVVKTFKKFKKEINKNT